MARILDLLGEGCQHGARCARNKVRLWSPRMGAVILACGLLCTQIVTDLRFVDLRPALEVRYSDGLLVTVELTGPDGGIAGQSIVFMVQSAAQGISCEAGRWPATDGMGQAGPLKVRFVDGVCTESWVAGDGPGEPYVVSARFAGDASMAPATSEVEIALVRENASVRLLPEHGARLGEELLLVATLVDESGDVAVAGDETTGRFPGPVASVPLSFFLDLNGDGDFVDFDEELGAAVTNGDGVASRAFDTTPVDGWPRAGLHHDAVHAQFSGDRRYKFAAATADLRLEPAQIEAGLTLLRATPEAVPADGFSRVLLDLTLRDAFGNPLGPDDEAHLVEFETSAGTLLEVVQREPTSGHYQQELEAPRAPITATITARVEGQPAASIEVVFTGEGCGCRGTGDAGMLAMVGLGQRRRRRWT